MNKRELFKDKDLITEIERINNKLENTLKDWKELSDFQFNNSVNTFIKIVDEKDLDSFLKMSSFSLFNSLNDTGIENLGRLVRNNTDWLENKDVIKKLIIADSRFLEWVDSKLITTSLFVEIFEENSAILLSNIWLKEKYRPNFDEVLKDEKLLDVFLSKKVYLSSLFRNVDVTKIPDKFYQDKKYWDCIFENFKFMDASTLIWKIPQSWMQEEDLWEIAWSDAIRFYGKNVEKFISKEQLLSAKVINYFINGLKDYSVFNDYYDEIINDDELMKELLNWGGNYRILKHIKNEDLYKFIDVVIERIEELEEELEE